MLKPKNILLAAACVLSLHLPAHAGGAADADKKPAAAALVPVGGSYTLQSATGQTVSNKTYLGKVQLIFFGFTSCPDICSTVMADVSKAMADLGADAAKVQPIFITIDPEHDTAQRLKDYLGSFDSRIVGLRGNAAQTQAAVNAFRVYSKKRPIGPDEGMYSMDHSAMLYVLKRDGSLGKLLSGDAPVHSLAGDIRSVL